MATVMEITSVGACLFLGVLAGLIWYYGVEAQAAWRKSVEYRLDDLEEDLYGRSPSIQVSRTRSCSQAPKDDEETE